MSSHFKVRVELLLINTYDVDDDEEEGVMRSEENGTKKGRIRVNLEIM